MIRESTASVRFSLRTRDLGEAKLRQALAAAFLEQTWAAYRASEPTTLSHRQCIALAGSLYGAWADENRSQTLAILHTSTGWQRTSSDAEEEEAGFASALGGLVALTERGEVADLEAALGPLVDRLLLSKGIAEVTPSTRPMLLRGFLQALQDAFAARQRNLSGDYAPDPNAQRFPAWEPPTSAPAESSRRPPTGTKTTLTGLLEDWWVEAKATGRKPSTYESYRRTVAAFGTFLKHDDAGRMNPEDVIRFKDYRLASKHPRTGKPISAKTVKDSDLAGLKTVFGWAVANRRLASNPALGVTIKLAKPAKLRSKGFTDEEARAILKQASEYRGGVAEQPRTVAAKRWVPWLCAYTGARVGELAQLRKQDLRQAEEHWVITITPEAGTVKTNEAREVVLSPHLAELGFPAFVASAPAGHLFLKPAPRGDVRGPLRGLKNRLAAFARQVVRDPHVAPNHAWRHRFKTVGREAGIDGRVLDAIQGQAPRTVAESYGEVSLRAQAAAVLKMPRITL